MTDPTGPSGHDLVHPVILCGGSGARLWPLSRTCRPKQFLALDGRASMLTETAQRLTGPGFAPVTAICSEEHRFLAAEALRNLETPPRRLILEPSARHTAAAIGIAALDAAEQGPETLVLVLPSDHVVRDLAGFHKAVARGRAAAAAGRIATFGVQPHRAETAFGYIERGPALAEAQGGAEGGAEWGAEALFEIGRFVEKPDALEAERLVSGGAALWNAGMFLFRADVALAAFERCAPEILAPARAAWSAATRDVDFVRLHADTFDAVPAAAFDVAVMEKTNRGAVAPVDLGWSDIGSWRALWEASERDANDNALRGDVIAQDSKKSFAWSASGQLLALVGVEDLALVATPDAVLAAPLDRAAEVRELVAELERRERKEWVEAATMYRPWGNYTTIDRGPGYLTKRIVVAPGGRLSLQYHHHRAEHWVVVDGIAKVTCDDKVFTLTRNQATYIPQGAVHRLENEQETPLTMIEVQSGDILLEEDIVRVEDTYGRAPEGAS